MQEQKSYHNSGDRPTCVNCPVIKLAIPIVIPEILVFLEVKSCCRQLCKENWEKKPPAKDSVDNASGFMFISNFRNRMLRDEGGGYLQQNKSKRGY